VGRQQIEDSPHQAMVRNLEEEEMIMPQWDRLSISTEYQKKRMLDWEMYQKK
jgi:hypothetical protein